MTAVDIIWIRAAYILDKRMVGASSRKSSRFDFSRSENDFLRRACNSHYRNSLDMTELSLKLAIMLTSRYDPNF